MSVAQLAMECTADTHTPLQRDSLWQAVHGALLASASVSAAQGRGSERSSDDSVLGRRPPGEGDIGDAGWWLHEYTRVTDHHDKCAVIRRAGWYLRSLTVRPRASMTGEAFDIREETERELHIRIVNVGQGWNVRDVAVHCRVTDAVVMTARARHGRDPQTGEILPAPAKDAAGNRQAEDLARTMHAADIPTLVIALVLDRSPRTIRHWTSQRNAA